MNLDMLKKKRKADEAFESEYEYVYGIVTTGEKCWKVLGTRFCFYLFKTNCVFLCGTSHGLVFHST
jgi:hypothetical protein